MTKEELKFALAVESFINTVPTPEYRQLLVEATTVLGALVTHDEDARIQLNCIVSLDDLVAKANRIFLEDQVMNSKSVCLSMLHQELTFQNVGVRIHNVLHFLASKEDHIIVENVFLIRLNRPYR